MEKRNEIKDNKGKYIIGAIFIIYILLLLKITLFRRASITQIFTWDVGLGFRSVNLIPFKTMIGFITGGGSF